MPGSAPQTLEPWSEDDYWALTDRHGRVLARLEIAGVRLATASKDGRIQEHVAFLNRNLAHKALEWGSPEQFLGAYSRSPQNLDGDIQVRPIFH
jgi:hypothetical protein